MGMSKIRYTKCDLCGEPIDPVYGKYIVKHETGRDRFEFTRKLDICYRCWRKIQKYIEENKNDC